MEGTTVAQKCMERQRHNEAESKKAGNEDWLVILCGTNTSECLSYLEGILEQVIKRALHPTTRVKVGKRLLYPQPISKAKGNNHGQVNLYMGLQ